MTAPAPGAMNTTQRHLPWVVAMALFMEQLDSTIVNTSIPAIAASLGTTPLSLKAVAGSYIISLAVCLPLSGWLSQRFGARRVFLSAIGLFTLSSVACGLAVSAPMLVAARTPQGMAAAMMMPVGRMAIVRTFPRAELLRAMNFVIVPALLGPLLGPTVGGLIVHWLSWRDIFFINVPVGLAALWFGHRHMPDYKAETREPLDLRGFVLFGGGTAVLSWALELLGTHALSASQSLLPVLVGLLLIGAYAAHALRVPHPLLSPALFRVRTFRVAVLGGFITRLGLGGLPFLLPLHYQLGLGLPAWFSGLLMMPSAVAAMGMKMVSPQLLARFGYRQVLIVNTVLAGATIALFAFVGPTTPTVAIVALSLSMGLFNSLQFSSMNSMAYADVRDSESAMAATIASTMQQLSMSFGLACGSLVVGFFLERLGPAPAHAPVAVVSAMHETFAVLGVITALSSLSFWSLRRNDGASLSSARPLADVTDPHDR
jgi:EmrB/QacA subfamily drug resistance transporter